MEQKIVMYTDGGSRNNPGPAAIGVHVETLRKQYGHYIGEKTNNEAEYEAVIFGLKKIKQLIGKEKAKEYLIECYLDSEFVAKQLKHEYKVKEENIQKLFLEVWNLMLDFKEVKFNHIYREKNKIADALVNQALDEKEKQATLL
ncbi:MAG TPA: ribonuclease HI family protein [Candidatus Moranbacteria bacterium]|jgi:ribonuclease HI|nr:ribonuclease HI family protein [Candidatus Moranbacteria bacterium]HPX94569.1 ribonuclease HI family protein [Candidatus Moranbacteria bacterium]HQB59553.1 ribonuclease HI family protein [Candidatus Moranbacteria bacterium]